MDCKEKIKEMRITTFTLLLLTLFVSAPFGQLNAEEKGKTMTVKKITPILFAAEIEPSLKFWTERLGFEKTIDVPEGNKLGFAIVQKGGVELMYQSYASAEKDISATSSEVRKGPSFLYVEVESLDEIIAAIKKIPVVMPVRTTFYGAKEIGIKDPAGHIIIFAQLGVAPQH
jgi:uncharacterized glyoxalase superfamily protein PhnB